MLRHPQHPVLTAFILTALTSTAPGVFASSGEPKSIEPSTILIAGAGAAGFGAQTSAQSSAASSAGSNAAASTVTPATTPSSGAGLSPGRSAPASVSNPSFLPNSSSTNVSPSTAPNGPARSTPLSTNDNNSAATSAPNAPLPTLNNLAGQSASPSSNQSAAASRNGGISASGGGASGKPNAAQAGSAQLRGLIGAPGQTSSDKPENSVESFFQVNAAKTGPGYALINSGAASSSSAGANHSALWHIMDNLGIPLPTGSNAEALDPSLRRNYVNPEVPNINNYKTRSGKTQTVSRGYQPPPVPSTQPPAPTAINMQKIPASELEGVDYSAKNDDQNKQK